MQFINNDMDELMRKAAEHYPLQPTGADWQKVAQQLDGKGVVSNSVQQQNAGKRCLFLLTFLLASLVCNKYIIFNYQKTITGPAALVEGDKSIRDENVVSAKAAKFDKQSDSLNKSLLPKPVAERHKTIWAFEDK